MGPPGPPGNQGPPGDSGPPGNDFFAFKICNFHVLHDEICFPPQTFASVLFSISLGLIIVLYEIADNTFVSGAREFDHISPILVKLHWLPISYHVVFKLLLLVFKALNGLGPRYLVELFQYQNHSRKLRPNFQELLLQQKSNKTYGDRAFSTCAPRLWNNIPLDIRKLNSVSTFKKN